MDNKQAITAKELVGEVQRLLQSADYQLEEPEIPKEFMGKPDFYGKRQDGEATHEICGLVRGGLKDLPRAITHLWTIKRQLGNAINYAIALPPVDEKDLVDFLHADKNKFLKKIKREEIQIWLYNPEDKNVCSVFGPTWDSLLVQKFGFRDLGI